MAKLGRSLQDLSAEIERRAEAKRDFIVPISKMEIVPVVEDEVGGVKPRILLHNGSEPLGINEIAHGQIAEYTSIPLGYYRRMLEADPQLLASNVNRWLADRPDDRRMVRTLDGTARAFLSDKFRPLENEDLADAVLPILLDADLLVISCEITDRRLYIKAVDRRIERDVPTGRRMGDGSSVFFDTVSPAITISNSEVGYGALAIETGVYTRACTNLAMIGTNLRKYHTGARATVSDEVYALLTDDTKRATDLAVWKQVRDLVKAAFDEAKFMATVGKLVEAAKDPLPHENVIEVIDRASRRFSLSDGERKGVLAALIEGGDLSRYGLHAAVTRYSQAEALTYDRATELERVGGEIIELPRTQWRELVAA